MKLIKNHLRILVCGLSFFVLPFAFAGGGDKKFAKMDTDGDGAISKSEHSAGAQRMFAEMDSSGDGVVTVREMDAMIAKSDDKNRGEMSAKEKLSMADQNSDGRLLATEHAAHAEAMFGKMDTNGDGSLSMQEHKAGLEMKKKHKRDS
jgi:Ca2+-binding EF-hand superfamily protein